MEDILLINYFKNKELFSKELDKEIINNNVDIEGFNTESSHFTEEYATIIVDKMKSKYGDIETVGGHFCIEFTKQLFTQISVDIDSKYTVGDLHVAINTSYKMLHEVYTRLFGSSADIYILETAIAMWFGKCDKHENLIWEYHK